jgi:hypothetical protein
MRRLALVVLLAVGLAGPALAQVKGEYLVPDPPKPKAAATDGLRGAAPAGAFQATKTPKAPTPPVMPPPRVAPGRPRDLTLMSPNLSQPAAPRLRGWDGAAAPGGAQCRTSCSRDQYVCLAGDGGDCNAIWVKCVAACPEGSSGAL